MPERLFPLFGCFCHILEKDRRALYWRRLAGTINFPPPRLLRTPSPLHDERIVSWVKSFTHALLDGNGRSKFQTSLSFRSKKTGGYRARDLRAAIAICAGSSMMSHE